MVCLVCKVDSWSNLHVDLTFSVKIAQTTFVKQFSTNIEAAAFFQQRQDRTWGRVSRQNNWRFGVTQHPLFWSRFSCRTEQGWGRGRCTHPSFSPKVQPQVQDIYSLVAILTLKNCPQQTKFLCCKWTNCTNLCHLFAQKMNSCWELGENPGNKSAGPVTGEMTELTDYVVLIRWHGLALISTVFVCVENVKLGGAWSLVEMGCESPVTLSLLSLA